LRWYIELDFQRAEHSKRNGENAMNGSRRQLLTRAVAAAAAIATSPSAFAQLAWNRGAQAPTEADYFDGTAFDHGVEYRATNMALIPKEFRPQITSEIIDPEPGGLVIDTREHFLYLTRADGTAIRYAVGVGREGFQWFGSAKVMRKGGWPTWTPPTEMVKRNPDISPATMKGGALNPMGPRALYLYRDGRDLLYRIHGTLEPWTIGSDVSSGCIRLLPEDLIDLYDRVPTGTDVLVMKHLV
jgi:lipoprotein-anchoring transpeptidase ErfK/SrfK